MFSICYMSTICFLAAIVIFRNTTKGEVNCGADAITVFG